MGQENCAVLTCLSSGRQKLIISPCLILLSGDFGDTNHLCEAAIAYSHTHTHTHTHTHIHTHSHTSKTLEFPPRDKSPPKATGKRLDGKSSKWAQQSKQESLGHGTFTAPSPRMVRVGRSRLIKICKTEFEC